MAGFALAASISPGPVNLLTLRAAALHGLARGLAMAWGATLGFGALLLLAGLGLQQAWQRWPLLGLGLRYAGIAFLLWMAWQLLRSGDSSELGGGAEGQRAGVWLAASAQWLNPKAWLAALAGMGMFGVGDLQAVLRFALLYAIVCLASMACWAWAGAWLGPRLRGGPGLRRLNQILAALLLLSALALLR